MVLPRVYVLASGGEDLTVACGRTPAADVITDYLSLHFTMYPIHARRMTPSRYGTSSARTASGASPLMYVSVYMFSGNLCIPQDVLPHDVMHGPSSCYSE
jgi:hypothetical protein